MAYKWAVTDALRCLAKDARNGMISLRMDNTTAVVYMDNLGGMVLKYMYLVPITQGPMRMVSTDSDIRQISKNIF